MPMATRTRILVALCLISAACFAGVLGSGRPLEDQVVPTAQPLEWKAPWFCHDLQCPKYSVLARYDGGAIQLREYAESTWVSTNVTGKTYDAAVLVGFSRLFDYISGANEDRTKIEMTVPVRIRASLKGSFFKEPFTVSFPLPRHYQHSKHHPPEPTSDRVFIEFDNVKDVYVASYDGYSYEDTFVKRLSDLQSDLNDLGLGYDDSAAYSAVYDPPLRIIGRHNEVWIPAVDKPE